MLEMIKLGIVVRQLRDVEAYAVFAIMLIVAKEKSITYWAQDMRSKTQVQIRTACISMH